MTPEEQEHEEKLAALVAANLSALQTVDAVNRANAGHISISKGNQRILSLTVDPAERRHADRSEEHTSEFQSPDHLVCRLLLEKKKRGRTDQYIRSEEQTSELQSSDQIVC